MKSIFGNLVVASALTALASAADNSIGTWKHNAEKSNTTNVVSNPITKLTRVIQAVDGGIKETVTGTRKDGTAVNGGFTAKYDGKEYPATGASWDRIAIKQIDANTFDSETRSTTGKAQAKSRMTISADGKTMTFNTQGTNSEEKPFTAVSVYDKQ